MKRILIVGKNSYIGSSFEDYLKCIGDTYEVDKISVKDDKWRYHDFSKYDVVLDVAGIAHIKITPDMSEIFYKVNRDLTIEICEKSKREGVAQFIYLSSMNVYGDTSELITKNTVPVPKNFYGDSKLQADIAIQKMNSDTFKVASVRPPVVYGRGCKGNYPKLSKYSRILFFFPDFKNTRSVIYIDNLCEFLRMIIDHNNHGIFHPQNKEYTSTREIVGEILKVHGKKNFKFRILNPIIRFLMYRNRLINRVFADDYYSKELSGHFDYAYCVVDFQNSIKNTELRNNKNA